VTYLRQMLQKDQDVHKQENSRIMKENVTLLQEINDLKKEEHTLQQKLKKEGYIDKTMGSTGRSKLDLSMHSKGLEPLSDLQKEIQLHEQQIQDMDMQIKEIQEENEMLKMQQPRVG